MSQIVITQTTTIADIMSQEMSVTTRIKALTVLGYSRAEVARLVTQKTTPLLTLDLPEDSIV